MGKNKIFRLCNGRSAATALPWNAFVLAIIPSKRAEGAQAMRKNPVQTSASQGSCCESRTPVCKGKFR